MKKIQPIYALFFTLVLLYAFSSNPPNKNTGAPGDGNCTSCHTPNNSGFEGLVTIAGLPNEVTPSTTYDLSIVTKITAGSPSRAGFQMVVLDENNNNTGALMNGDATSAVASDEGRDYLEHKSSKPFNNIDSVEWAFQWTTPADLATDSIRFYINNIIGNGSGSSGDLMVSNRPVVAFVQPPADPIVVQVVESQDVSCFDEMDGAASVSATGGRGDITFLWSNGETTSAISNLSIGRYVVTATDAEGNEGTAAITIEQPEELSIEITNTTNVDCINTTGNATAQASGGTGPYTYFWNTNKTGETVDLDAGTFRVTVIDANNCNSSTSVTIDQDIREPIAFAGFDVSVTCADTNSSTVQLDAFNTTTGSGVNYLWTTENGNIVSGETTLMPTVDAAGSYILTVSNTANGCTAIDTTEVSFDLNIPIADAGESLQLGCENNAVNLDGSGSSQGTNIVYNWTTEDGNIMSGDTTLMPLVTSAGTYTLTVRNASTGCFNTASITVTQDATLPMADAGMTQQLDCNNSIAILVGSASIGEATTVLWTTEDGNIIDGATTLNPMVDSAGTYVLTVTDNGNNCSAMSSVTVTENFDLPTVEAGTATLDCTTTTITLNGTGEIGDNFIYVWTTTDGTIISGDSTLTPVIEGGTTYTLTAINTDNGCMASSELTISQNMEMPMANAGTDKQLDCDNPSIILDGSGSTGDSITYLWTTEGGNIMMGDSTLTPTVNGAGTYTLTVTNSTSGCTTSASVMVTQDATLPMVALDLNTELGCDTDTLVIIGMGSTGDNISYVWSTTDGAIIGSDTTLEVMIVGAGTYTLMVSDEMNNCSSSASITVSNTVLPVANAGTTAILGCNNRTTVLDGSASTGDDITYLWTTENGNIVSDADTPMPTVDTSGIYTLRVTNAAGCSSMTTVEVIDGMDTDLFAASGDVEQLTCIQTSITLNANASQGENIIYVWTTEGGNIVEGGMTLMPTIDAPGKYFLTVRDTTTGCEAISSLKIAEDVRLPIVSAGDSLTLDCGTTSVNLNGSSETQFNLTYTWTTENGNILNGANTANPEVNASGTYTLTVVDTFTNCAASSSVTVGQDASVPMSNAGMTMPFNCTTDTLTLAGSGSTGDDYTILWSTENGNILEGTTTFTPTVDAAGTYVLTVTDTAAGCTSTSSVTIISDREKPMVEAGAAEQFLCEDGTLAITGTASEGDNFTYFWCTEDGGIESGAEDLNVVINGAGLFEFIVTNTTNGCKDADTVMVTGVSNPELTTEFDADSMLLLNIIGGTAPYIYEWNIDSISNEPSTFEPGDYELTLTDANGCTDFIAFTIETSTNTNELEQTIESLQVFPNPTIDYLNLKVDFTTTQSGAIFILNNMGQKMWQQTFDNRILNYQIDANNWAGGQYFMVIQTADGLRTEEIMVIR